MNSKIKPLMQLQSYKAIFQTLFGAVTQTAQKWLKTWTENGLFMDRMTLKLPRNGRL